MPSDTVTEEELMLRAIAMFLGGEGHPGRSGRGGIVDKVSNELAHRAKTVVLQLFETRRAEVRWVKETAQLDQEEALAYLLADVLDYELLPGEGRAIGDAARHAALIYKGKPKRKPGAPKAKPSLDQKLKDKASTDKSKARAAADKDPALVDGLAQRLADIDTALVDARRELAEKEVKLDWPARDTVIVEPRPPTATEANESAAAKLRRLRKAAAEAEEAVAIADAHRVAARREWERAKGAIDQVREMMLVMRGEHLRSWREQSELDAEWEEMKQAREQAATNAAQLCAIWADAMDDLAAAKQDALEAQWAVQEAEAASAAEARETARAAEHAEWEAELAARRQACQQAHDEAMTDGEAREARANALRAEVAARPTRYLSEIMVPSKTPDETRAMLQADAVRVWGEGAGSITTPPRVISLVGKSPESVRTIGESRIISQQITM